MFAPRLVYFLNKYYIDYYYWSTYHFHHNKNNNEIIYLLKQIVKNYMLKYSSGISNVKIWWP